MFLHGDNVNNKPSLLLHSDIAFPEKFIFWKIVQEIFQRTRTICLTHKL